ncbi:MAG TPA: beta-propeller domain-containing protein, partial [Acidimicrobiales bacterium]
MRPIRTIAALAATAALAAACSQPTDPPPGAGGGDLQLVRSLEPIGSCDELHEWAVEELAPRAGTHGFGGGPVVMEDMATDGMAGAEALPAPAAGDAAGRTTAADADAAFSGTNVQVEGVDEPDVVKTDGERILAIAGGRLHLASVADRRVVAAVDLPEGLGHGELLLSGDRALLLGNGSFGIGPVPFEEGPAADLVVPPTPATVVAQVDIGDGELTLTDRAEIDGSYVSARMVGDVARLVLHADPQQRLPFVAPANPSPEAARAAAAHNREVVEQADPEDLLPRWRRDG